MKNMKHTSDKAEPVEIERKFFIEYPDISYLENNPLCRKLEIVQTYLVPENVGEEVRVRSLCENGCYTYTITAKKKITDIKRIEVERAISREEYLKESERADCTKAPICKTRYCLMYEGKKFEIDVYPFWCDKAVMEIELDDENESFDIPGSIKIIKEITGDESYKNSAIARLVLESKE